MPLSGRRFRPLCTAGLSQEAAFGVGRFLIGNRNSVLCDAVGGSRPQHQNLNLAVPKEVEHWSLTTLRQKLLKIGAKVASHGRYVTFQLAEVAVPRNLFREILRRIDALRPRPAPV